MDKEYPDWMCRKDAFFEDPLISKWVVKVERWMTYFPFPEALFREARELSQILVNALPTYLYLCSYINRKPEAEWGNLGDLYKKGHLATFRHQKHIANELGLSVWKVSTDVRLLEKHNFLRIENGYWTGKLQYKGGYHGNFYYLGYWLPNPNRPENCTIDYLFSFAAIGKWIEERPIQKE